MRIEMHMKNDNGNWNFVQAGNDTSPIWTTWDRNWIDRMLDTPSETLRIGNTMFMVNHSPSNTTRG